ncbi:cation:proton antiporter [Campylobacter troglodytis]|uniref:cation:proton antiporter n=1 Tax=Campylobacter troglodytis TaxID=654363 RepID=UPI00115737F1|nr:cation:proton antiporter [Campylobacter troglodytis]TQR60188.1 sodium:proton antiporter [Campylobacter troglodytis]
MIEGISSPQALVDLKILVIVGFCLLFSPYLARLLRLPVSAVEIMLGASAAALALINESSNFKLLANVGFYYLMFMAGMEVNLRSFLSIQKSFLKRALLYIILLYALSALTVSVYELSYIFIIILPVMSVGLLGILIKDYGKNYEWLNISFLVATLAEVVSIVLLTVVAAFLHNNNILAVGKSIIYLLIFLVLCLLCFKLLKVIFWWYPNLKNAVISWQDKDEKDVRFCMGIFVLVICAMLVSGLELALGAFIAGSFIATFFDQQNKLEHKLSGFGFGFLIPIFFIYIGSTFDLRALLDREVLKDTLFLFVAMLMLRLLCAGVFLKKFKLKDTILFGLSHSMPLTLLIATATLSYEASIIDKSLYSALILVSLLEAVFVMTVIKFLFNFKRVTN